MKKRYWIFLFDDFYPCGGMSDFAKDFDTLEELKDSREFKEKRVYEYNKYDNTYCWSGVKYCMEIYDSHEDKIIKDLK